MRKTKRNMVCIYIYVQILYASMCAIDLCGVEEEDATC